MDLLKRAPNPIHNRQEEPKVQSREVRAPFHPFTHVVNQSIPMKPLLNVAESDKSIIYEKSLVKDYMSQKSLQPTN